MAPFVITNWFNDYYKLREAITNWEKFITNWGTDYVT